MVTCARTVEVRKKSEPRIPLTLPNSGQRAIKQHTLGGRIQKILEEELRRGKEILAQ